MKFRKRQWILYGLLVATALSVIVYLYGQKNQAEMNVPQLFQFNYETPVLYRDGKAKSVATSGCGAVSASMVISYLTGNADQNPYTLFCKAVEAGKYDGGGLSHHTLSWLCEEYGVEVEWTSGNSKKITEAIQNGCPIIAHMGPGTFTKTGHYIVLRGLTKGGEVLINDPNSLENCEKSFSVELLIDEAKGSESFGICRRIQ